MERQRMGIGDNVQVMRPNRWNNEGFTLVEILIALSITVVVMGSIFYAFKSQQDSYVVQSQVTTMQQTLRGSMYMLTRDVQMAGYYTNFDPDDYTMDWDNLDGDNETIRPLLYIRNDVTGVTGIRNNTDVIVIVKASLIEGRELGSTEHASGSTLSLTTSDLDGDGDDDLQADYCGVLVKSDLSRAEFFELDGSGGLVGSLTETYSQGDRIHRADVIKYYVDDDPDRPGLRRHNLGNNESGGQLVAENIENLQVRYQLNSGTWVDDPHNPPTYTAANVRAVQIFLVARTDHTIRGWTDADTYPMWAGATYTPPTADSGFRRKTLCSTTEIRNIGS
jgi:prepilin-type N-terminal cleavage/methylation domain-containing protein